MILNGQEFDNIIVNDTGTNNTIIVNDTISNIRKMGMLNVVFQGNNNQLVIDEGTTFKQLIIGFMNIPNHRCNGSTIKIGGGYVC